MRKPINIFDALTEDKDILSLMKAAKGGIKYNLFNTSVNKGQFSINEWSRYLHLSTRTMQRYQSENKTFDVLQSGVIIKIALLYKRGVTVFGNKENFNTWLESSHVALGNSKPKDLLDNPFGIDLVSDELTRIEHGLLA
jgi:putative toxin-antitoxin system antitoxin component (TIGR02293 family)